jgi:hypothetical protein
VKSLDLRGNLLNNTNYTLLLAFFPNLEFIDARENPDYDCTIVPPAKLTVLSDCPSTSEAPAPTMSSNPTRTSVPSFFPKSRQTRHNNQSILIISLSVGSFLTILIAIIWVIKKRRQRFHNASEIPLTDFNLPSSVSSSDSEECLYNINAESAV